MSSGSDPRFSFADEFFNGDTGDEAKYGFLMIHGANREISGFKNERLRASCLAQGS
jgi:hypothetical protein